MQTGWIQTFVVILPSARFAVSSPQGGEPVGAPAASPSQHRRFGGDHRLALHQRLRGDRQLGEGLRAVLVRGHDRAVALVLLSTRP